MTANTLRQPARVRRRLKRMARGSRGARCAWRAQRCGNGLPAGSTPPALLADCDGTTETTALTLSIAEDALALVRATMGAGCVSTSATFGPLPKSCSRGR